MREMNAGIIERTMARCEVPCLIPPRARAVPSDGEYPFGIPEHLPEISCVGRFTSLAPAKDLRADGSALTVLWFQDTFALPISEEAAAGLRRIDWEGRS